MSKLKVAIIGCGRIATSAHTPAYLDNFDLAEVKYYCDIIPERAKTLAGVYSAEVEKRYGEVVKPEIVEDYHDILGKVDCVSVCTPNGAHCPIACDFLRAGAQVLSEKPAAINLAKAEEMKKVADETGNMLSIGVCNRFNDAVMQIHDLIEQGALGDIYHVYCSFRAHRSIPGLGGPFTTKAESGGGVLIDWGVHYLDLIFYCMGERKLKTVSAETYSVLGRDIDKYVCTAMWAGPRISNGTYDVEEYVTGMVRLEDEKKSISTITLEGAWSQNIGESDTYVDFIGDKGGIRLQYGKNFVLYSTCNGMLTETKYDYSTENMYSREVRDFLTNAPKKVKTRASIDHAIKTSELMEMLYKSAAEHKEIEM